MSSLTLRQDHSPFALVLIDGDGTIFQDHLLERGADGGSEAAHLLLSELRAKLKDRYPSAAPWSVVVNIYANLDDLARKLYSIKIINKQSDLQDFARGFTISQPLFNFIDIGRGKERADHKLRGKPCQGTAKEEQDAILRNSVLASSAIAHAVSQGFQRLTDFVRRDVPLIRLQQSL